MGRVTFQQPIAKFHGKASNPGPLNGQVYYTVGNAGYSRSYVVPANPDTSPQQLIRSYQAASSISFNGLSESDANNWRALAATLPPRVNPLGSEYDWTGTSLYSSVNNYRQMAGQSISATLPSTSSPGTVSAVNSATYAAGSPNTIAVEFDHTISVGAFVYMRLTLPLAGSARNARLTDFRTITTAFADSIVARASSPQTITLDQEAFAIDQADYIGVLLQPLNSAYFPGTPFLEKNIVVA